MAFLWKSEGGQDQAGWWPVACAAAAIVLAAFGGVLRPVLLGQGYVRPIRVTESSMVPFLYGEVATVVCRRCGTSQPVEQYDPADSGHETICVACGQRFALPDRWQPRVGDRVTLFPLPVERPGAERWQVVAFRRPLGGTATGPDLAVKRVVALPGEALAIRQGDLYIDGAIARKSLEQYRELAIGVSDSGGRPGCQNAWAVWRPAESPSGWRHGVDGFHFAPDGFNRGWQWLAFRGPQVVGRSSPRWPVLDDYPFNHADSRRLFPVADVLLRAEIQRPRAGKLACRAVIDEVAWQLTWDLTRCLLELGRDGQVVVAKRLLGPHVPRQVVLEFAHCDRQLLAAIDGTERLRYPVCQQDRSPSADHALTELALGAWQARATITRLQTFRDIHYLTAEGNGGPTADGPWRLGADQFFLLGDNCPLSVDSRHYGPVERRDFVGVVKRWGQQW
jgi:hypothetical protein